VVRPDQFPSPSFILSINLAPSAVQMRLASSIPIPKLIRSLAKAQPYPVARIQINRCQHQLELVYQGGGDF
jgi:hypothetical protein